MLNAKPADWTDFCLAETEYCVGQLGNTSPGWITLLFKSCPGRMTLLCGLTLILLTVSVFLLSIDPRPSRSVILRDSRKDRAEGCYCEGVSELWLWKPLYFVVHAVLDVRQP